MFKPEDNIFFNKCRKMIWLDFIDRIKKYPAIAKDRIKGTVLITVGTSRTAQTSSTRRLVFHARSPVPNYILLVPIIHHLTAIAG